jgi:hypothetical protein
MGLVPVLVEPGTKKPLGGGGWADKARLMTSKEFRRTLRENPGAGLGVLLGLNGKPGWTTELWGPRRGVVDIEVDDAVLAVEPLKRIWQEGIPKTLRFRANRGLHHLFAINEDSAQALRRRGITQAVIKDDPSYPGLELRFGTLDPARRMAVQSVVPPTPRTDGTPRKWHGAEPLPLPTEFIEDLGVNSRAARDYAAQLAAQAASTKNREHQTIPRENLLGLTPLEKVQEALSWLKIRFHPEGNGFASRCPCHRGRKANFCFCEDKPGGMMLIYCQRGCEFAELLNSLGLRPGDLYPDDSGNESVPKRRCSNITATKDVREISPELLDRLERMQEQAREALQADPERAQELVRRLGLSTILSESLESLELMGAGYLARTYIRLDRDSEDITEVGGAWTFPMVDAEGTIVNLQRRFVDDSIGKRGVYGGRNGLFVPQNWRERPGPIYLVEGASDTLALTAIGQCAIGRPSNRGGLADVVALLKKQPREREIVVLGENDQKDGDWPGDPQPFAKRLAGGLRRYVKWTLPPSQFKDMREHVSYLLVTWRGRASE